MMDHQRDLRDIPMADLGDTPTFGASTEMVDGVTKMAADVIGAGKIPIVIGGGDNPPPGGVRAGPQKVGGVGIRGDPPFPAPFPPPKRAQARLARPVAGPLGGGPGV